MKKFSLSLIAVACAITPYSYAKNEVGQKNNDDFEVISVYG